LVLRMLHPCNKNRRHMSMHGVLQSGAAAYYPLPNLGLAARTSFGKSASSSADNCSGGRPR
jgi:hypothetical protein